MCWKKKLTELENRTTDFSSLATKTALIAVENKISDVSILVKKKIWHKNQWAWKEHTDYDHDKNITNPEFNTVAADFFNSRLAEANLIQRHILMLNTHVLMEKLHSIRRTCWQWVAKDKNFLFKVFHWRKSFWRRLYT